jgi:hypothetical protein
MHPNYLRRDTEGAAAARLLPGLILVGVGALFLLDNLHLFPIRDLVDYWPAILLVAGLFKLVDATSGSDRAVGGILTAVGAIFLGQTLGIPYLNWPNMWPLALIGVGLLLLLNRLPWTEGIAGLAGGKGWEDGPIDDLAIFSGSKRVETGDFKGGKLTAIFGGVELDLREAEMSADSTELEIAVIFGGAVIRVPEHWSVVARCPGIFGGFNDRSHRPDMRQTARPRRLLVKGVAIFGGVEVKN